MRNSAPGVCGSEANWAKPPKSHSVTPSTSTSLRRAMMEWAISWARSEPRNSSAPTTATLQYAVPTRPGAPLGRMTVASSQLSRPPIRTTPGSIATGTPRIRPSLIEPCRMSCTSLRDQRYPRYPAGPAPIPPPWRLRCAHLQPHRGARCRGSYGRGTTSDRRVGEGREDPGGRRSWWTVSSPPRPGSGSWGSALSALPQARVDWGATNVSNVVGPRRSVRSGSSRVPRRVLPAGELGEVGGRLLEQEPDQRPLEVLVPVGDRDERPVGPPVEEPHRQHLPAVHPLRRPRGVVLGGQEVPHGPPLRPLRQRCGDRVAPPGGEPSRGRQRGAHLQ